jgi:hypothetical protein
MPQDAFQVFEAFGQIWRIEEALRRVADRQPETLVLDETLVEWARFLTEGEPITGRNLADPILVIPLPEGVFGPDAGHQVIDGWHRIAQAVGAGMHELPAHFLSSADERACRTASWDRDLAENLRESHEPWHALRSIA